MNDFDHAARFAARSLDPETLLRWLLGERFGAAWRWTRWLDTQAIPFPGETEQRMDVVAECERRAHDAPPLAVVIEFMSEPRGETLERLAEYALRVRRELPYQTDPRVKYDVVGVLVNLTGDQKVDVWQVLPPDRDGLGAWVRARVRNLATQDAGQHLAAVSAGAFSLSLLPWVPLMAGGGEAATVVEWRRLAEAEPDDRRRGGYGGLAVVFAYLAGCFGVWKKGLEGWNMQRSPITLEWEARGEVRGRAEERRAKLLRLLQLRFGPDLPAELVGAVEGQADLPTLDRWFDLGATAGNLEEVRGGFGLNGA